MDICKELLINKFLKYEKAHIFLNIDNLHSFKGLYEWAGLRNCGPMEF